LETIYLLVRNVVLIVLFAAFLEMLLPLRETRRFVEVVVGLFVLVTILNPVVAFFRQEPLLNLDLSQEMGEDELSEILRKGKDLEQTTVVQAHNAYGKHLEKQMAVMARMVPGVAQAKVKVELASSPAQQSAGAVEKVYITIFPETDNNERIAPVERVEITPGSNQQSSQLALQPDGGEIQVKVQETISSFFGLRPDQVVVSSENVR
jgi:stage III sporulation protein AF